MSNAQNPNEFRPKSLAIMGPLVWEGFTIETVKNKTGPGSHKVFIEKFSPVANKAVHITARLFEDQHDQIRAIKLMTPNANIQVTLGLDDQVIWSGVMSIDNP